LLKIILTIAIYIYKFYICPKTIATNQMMIIIIPAQEMNVVFVNPYTKKNRVRQNLVIDIKISARMDVMG
jgi:hypothetical protein